MAHGTECEPAKIKGAIASVGSAQKFFALTSASARAARSGLPTAMDSASGRIARPSPAAMARRAAMVSRGISRRLRAGMRPAWP